MDGGRRKNVNAGIHVGRHSLLQGPRGSRGNPPAVLVLCLDELGFLYAGLFRGLRDADALPAEAQLDEP